MAGTPDGPPPGWARAIGQLQAQQANRQMGRMLGQIGGLGVAQYQGYQTTSAFQPSFTTAEFAEEYYDQCFGTSRTPQERAYELLMEHLTDAEKNEWWDTGRVTVIGKSGRRYWISGTDCGRDDGHTFCVYIGMNECPAEDRVLGLKLAIQTDEAGFLKTAVDRSVSGVANGWREIQRAAMQVGMVGRLADPQRAMNEIFNAAIGQCHGVVFHENVRRVPWPMRTRLYGRFREWLRETIAEAFRAT